MKNNKKRIIFIVAILSLMLLLPSFEQLDNTYQESLWTSDTWRKHPLRLEDSQFAIGKNIDSLKVWTRIRLGFPIKAITLDIQWNEKIVQGRIEWIFLIPWIFLTIITLVILFISKRFQTK